MRNLNKGVVHVNTSLAKGYLAARKQAEAQKE
jgi:hypothetical protein